ncbi:MAG: hypothetical protein LC667_08720, partial [Thioalkalivibrio sp.]|nr:hypothetical protein [Thioalkalivibrio sp.]
ILGFVVAASKTVELVTRTVEQAASVRKRANPTFAADGVIVHSDAGSQLRFNRSSQHLQGGACGTTEGLEHGDDGEADNAVSGSAGMES